MTSFSVLRFFSKFELTYMMNFKFTEPTLTSIAQKMKFSIKDFFSKCDQIRSFLRIWTHLLKKSLIENFIFCAVQNSSKWEYPGFLYLLRNVFKERNWRGKSFVNGEKSRIFWHKGLRIPRSVFFPWNKLCFIGINYI